MKFFFRRGSTKTAARASTQEADQHLLAIRASKGLDPNSNVPQAIINDLEAAAKVLSDQLYQKSAHFLLELIQNADDNRYEANEPTIHLTYTKGHLRVDCNEVGFSAKDVDAICSIGQSSKSGAGVSEKYVGEKGIGFKSVFKACDVVWITSGGYEFKFDRNERLGMIAPIVDKFPQPRREGWTSFYLRLSQSYNDDEIISDLQSLDAKILIFLRRLRKVVVTVCRSGSNTSTKTLTRNEDRIDGNEVIHLIDDGVKLSYIIKKHIVRRLPFDERRSGVSESQLLIALPVSTNMEPEVDAQQVFAFLPIRDYGFKFLIQADFLLIASREDIDNSTKWNQKLRDELVVAFLQCVEWFNSGHLKYSWPRYLPSESTSTDFFSSSKSTILSQISNKPTMEAWNGTLTAPSKLMYIPDKYLDHSGVPLALTDRRAKSYLSRRYCSGDYEQIKLIGVTEMGDRDFLNHLEENISQGLGDIKNRPAQWHSRLAAVLSDIMATQSTEHETSAKSSPKATEKADKKFKGRKTSFFKNLKKEEIDKKAFRERILKLPLIELRNGNWVPAHGNQIFFPGDSQSWEIPGGIDVLVVDSEAASDLSRAHLFRMLGVSEFQPNVISQMVVDCLDYETSNVSKISGQDLISQTHFLYKSGWRNSNEKLLWLVTESNSKALSSTVYFDDPKETHSATKYFANHRKEFQFIHPDYYNQSTQDADEWNEWLKTNFFISNIPRISLNIMKLSPKTWTFHMSPDFEFIMTHWSYLSVLTLICDHWSTYSRWIKYPPSDSEANAKLEPSVETKLQDCYEKLRNRISLMPVKCKNGNFSVLGNTFLLQNDAPISIRSVPLLYVSDPENSRWRHLEEFGVGMQQDIRYYLQCLQSVSGQSYDHKQVTLLYEQIQASCTNNESKITVRNLFKEKGNLVYILPDLESPFHFGFWAPVHQCLWNGPRKLKAHFSLQQLYPSCERLFADILGISDLNMNHVVFEATNIRETDDVEFIHRICLLLEMFLEKDDSNKANLDALENKWIWPVTKERELGGSSKLLSTSKEWFIADTRELRNTFAGIVPLLSFDVDDVSQTPLLIHWLNLDSRRLSNAAVSVPKPLGSVTADPVHTEMLWTRYGFLIRLMPRSRFYREERKKAIRLLKNVNVHTAQHIIQGYTVEFRGKTMQGREKPGKVVLSPNGESLDIHVLKDYFQLGTPWELVDSLASFTKIDRDRDGKHLLQIVLTNPPERIREAFDRFGVPESCPEDNDEEEWQLPEKPRRPDLTEPLPGSNAFYTYFSTRIRLITSTSVDVTESREVGGHQAPPPYEAICPQVDKDDEHVDESLEFIGEEFISNKLKEAMGDKFVPEEHWTSPLRVKAGLPMPETTAASTFTIKDTHGAWTAIMSDLGYGDAKAWGNRPPTWHIEVKTSKGPLRDRFTFSQRALDMARKYQIPPTGRVHAPTDVMILIRVYNAETNPEFDVLVDPWALYVTGKIQLKSTGGYHGHLAI